MKLSTTIITRIFSGEFHRLFRHVSTSTAEKLAAKSRKTISKGFLFQKLYEVGTTGGKVSDVIHRAVRYGQIVTKSVIMECFKDLRKYGHYQQCLEILDWMEKGRIDYSSREFALRLAILCKLKGLAEVEKYFDDIPSDMKDRSTYGSLLNCYCTELATEKALDLFKKMDEMGYASHALPFNNVLDLYVKIGQPEKVPELIAEMKHRNIPLNPYTYSFWIQSYRHQGDFEGVERVYHETQEQDLLKDDWVIHSNVASVCIEFNQPDKAVFYLKKLENVLDNTDNANRLSYNYLISLYATVGESESAIRVWNKLMSKFKVNNMLSYISLLQALAKLDDIKGLEKYYREWDSKCENYEDNFDKVPAVLIGTYLKHDMLEEAELLLKVATEKAGRTLRRPYIKFMNYFFKKCETDLALKHMEAAINTKWKPLPEKLDPCFQHFNAKKDVDGLEKFCGFLKRVKPLDMKAYLWLLQTYADAGKTAPDMRERMKEDGVLIIPEIEELVERVCPNRF